MLATALCAALVAGCVPEETLPVDDPGPAAPGEPTVTVSPTTGAPGTEVTVVATGFPPDTEMEIGFGPPDAWYDEVDRVRTDGAGRAEVRLTVPSIDREGEYVFVVSEADARNGVQAVSERFTLQAGAGGAAEQPREGQLRIVGEVTDEGVECPAVRTRDGELYTLAGAPGWVEPGVRVEVEGPVAEMSICMQGTTLQVEQIRRL